MTPPLTARAAGGSAGAEGDLEFASAGLERQSLGVLDRCPGRTGHDFGFLSGRGHSTRPWLHHPVGPGARTGGIVSVQPRHHVRRWYEQLSAVANVVASMANRGTCGKASGLVACAVGFGPAMAVPASAYIRAGGHERAKSAVAEDLALARTMDMAGTPVVAYHSAARASSSTACTRMGCPPLSMVGPRTSPPVPAPFLLTPPSSLCGSQVRQQPSPASLAPFFYALYATQMTILMRRSGTFHPATAAFYPVSLAVFV